MARLVRQPRALHADAERLRYVHCAIKDDYPGPGSYSAAEGIADDKKRWMSATTWTNGSKRAHVAEDSPGPATYPVAASLGTGTHPTRTVSGRPAFSHDRRFPADARAGGVHAHQGCEDHSRPGSPSGTFPLTGREPPKVHTETPGPQSMLRGIAEEVDAAKLSPQRRRVHVSSAPRFPDPKERSPGPIYSVAETLKCRKGVRFPPREGQVGFFQFLEQPEPSATSATPAAPGTPTTAPEPSQVRTVAVRSGGGAASGTCRDINVASGATLSSGAFGRKTLRDTVFYGDMSAPGPQRYVINEAVVKRNAPAYSFAPQPSTNTYDGEVRRYFDERKQRDDEEPQARKRVSKKKPAGREAQYQVEHGQGSPGPGAYMLDASAAGPSYSISSPLAPPLKEGPGPCSYDAAKYKKVKKPVCPTFSRSDRFPQRRLDQMPGPGYYTAQKLPQKTQHAHGTSSTCPDVMGWMQKKHETERRYREELTEVQRRMVIMGTDDVAQKRLAPLTVGDRPRGTKRTIWY